MSGRPPLINIGPPRLQSQKLPLTMTSKRIRTPSARATPELIRTLAMRRDDFDSSKPSPLSTSPPRVAVISADEDPIPAKKKRLNSSSRMESLHSTIRTSIEEESESTKEKAVSVGATNSATPRVPKQESGKEQEMILVKKEEKTDAVEKEQELTRVEMESNGEIRVDSPKQDLEEPVDEAGGSSQERNMIVKACKDLPVGELTKIYTQAWEALDPARKAIFNSSAHKMNIQVGNASPTEPLNENEDECQYSEHLRLMQIINDVKANSEKKQSAAAAAAKSPKTPFSGPTNKKLEAIATQLGAKIALPPSPSASAEPVKRAASPKTAQQQPTSHQHVPANRVLAQQSQQKQKQPQQQAQPNQQQVLQVSQATALEFYYLSLCQPAFPLAGEAPVTPATPAFYLDQFLLMDLQRQAQAASKL